MIESPSAMGYLRISVYASLAMFGALGVFLLFVFSGRPAPPKPPPAVACSEQVIVNTSGWTTIEAGRSATLRVPPELHRVESPPRVGDSTTYWRSANGSLSMSIMLARASEPRWRSTRTVSTTPDFGRGTGDCLRDTIGGRPASVESNYWWRADGGSYYEVYANIRSDSDRVIRLEVTASDHAEQQIGLAIVRSLRFVTAPPPT